MLFPQRVGAELDIAELLSANDGRLDRTLFGEAASQILIGVDPRDVEQIESAARSSATPLAWLGVVTGAEIVIPDVLRLPIVDAERAWAQGLAH